MKLTIIISVVLVVCTLAGCATDRSDHHVLKMGQACDHLISNPYEWALQQFADGPIFGPDVSDYARLVLKYGLSQALADIGADGTQDLFLRQDCPARMWEVVVFAPVHDEYRYLGHFLAGTIVLHPDQQSVLVYEPCGGHYGYIKTYRHEGAGFVCADVQSFTVGDGASDENNRRKAELFPEDKVIKWTKVPNQQIHPIAGRPGSG